MKALLLITTVLGSAWEADAQVYTWQFHDVTGSPVSAQIISADHNFPDDAAIGGPLMTPTISSASFFIDDLSLNLNLAPGIDAYLQTMGPVEIQGTYAPDGGSGMWIGPLKGYAPALVFAGVNFTINPAENFPNAPDPQQWSYMANGMQLAGSGYWELESTPEPSTLALSLLFLSGIRWVIVDRKKHSFDLS